MDDGGRLGRARPRLHAAARQGAGHRAHRRGRQGLRPLPLGADDPLRLRPHRPVGAQAQPRAGHARRHRRSGRALLPHASRDARRGHAHGLGVLGRRGRARPVRPHVVPVARGGSGGDRPRAGAGRHRNVLAGVERGMPARAARRLGRARAAVAHRPQGADLRPDRRNRRRADDLAAGVDRVGAQLGLPLLLVARRDPHAAGPAPLQSRRRGGTVAALADPRDRGRSGRRPDHVRRRRRAAV